MTKIERYKAAIGTQALHNAGVSADEYAAEWLDAGVPVDEVPSWIESGTWEAASAAALRDAGITAAQAGECCPEGPCKGETIGYAVSNGDLSVERAEEICDD